MAIIVYLHGFNSGSASIKAQALGRSIAALPPASRPEYFIPRLHHRPAAAIRALAGWLGTRSRDALTLVGSSLGGYYATYLAERFAARAVLINPTVRPYADLVSYLGPQVIHTRARATTSRNSISPSWRRSP